MANSSVGRVDIELRLSAAQLAADGQPQLVWLLNRGEVNIGYGQQIALERWSLGEQWTPLPTYPADAVALTLQANERSEMQEVTSGNDFLLPGCYRVAKQVDVFTDDPGTITLIRQFTVLPEGA